MRRRKTKMKKKCLFDYNVTNVMLNTYFCHIFFPKTLSQTLLNCNHLLLQSLPGCHASLDNIPWGDDELHARATKTELKGKKKTETERDEMTDTQGIYDGNKIELDFLLLPTKFTSSTAVFIGLCLKMWLLLPFDSTSYPRVIFFIISFFLYFPFLSEGSEAAGG